MVFSAHHLALCCILGTLAACASTDFVPDTGWKGSESKAEFYEKWFGKQLAAAGEPPLVEAINLSGSVSRFRLLVLPSFYPASVYRIDEQQLGKFTLTLTHLDGAGGYDPGKVREQTQRELTSLEAAGLVQHIESAQLEETPMEHPLRFEDDGDGERVIKVCMDGTRIVVERLTKTGRQFITRHTCRLNAYPKLAELYGFITDLQKSD
ncbi:MAG: hypothetical protein ABJP70_09555 [Erythrobacter sp.]